MIKYFGKEDLIKVSKECAENALASILKGENNVFFGFYPANKTAKLLEFFIAGYTVQIGAYLFKMV